MTSLTVAPVGHEAAKFAVLNWHYSQRMPVGKLVKIGAWEDGAYIGVVLFSRGATRELGWPYGLNQGSACELTRVALRAHVTPVTQIVARAIAYLKRNNPGLRLIVSYADEGQGHHGGIYQAGNWVYVGFAQPSSVRLHGQITHARSIVAKYGHCTMARLRREVDPKAEWVKDARKHKYLMPLDRRMRRQIEPLAKPYPPALVKP